MQESARPAGVDDEARVDARARWPSRAALEHDAASLPRGRVRARVVVEIDRAVRLGLADERVIEVRPVPMRVADLVVRARGDQQLPRVLAIVGEALAGLVEEEREAAFQAAGDVGTCALPRAPFREHAGAGAGRSDPRALRAAGWPAASTIRRSRTADGGPARSSATRCPRRRSASAVSEPANPEPTTATSASIRMRPGVEKHPAWLGGWGLGLGVVPVPDSGFARCLRASARETASAR